MIVDEMHNEHPELLQDKFWNEVVPDELPYTVASENYRKYEPKGSAENFKIKPTDALYANIAVSKRNSHHQPDDAYADYVSLFNKSDFFCKILCFLFKPFKLDITNYFS